MVRYPFRRSIWSDTLLRWYSESFGFPLQLVGSNTVCVFTFLLYNRLSAFNSFLKAVGPRRTFFSLESREQASSIVPFHKSLLVSAFLLLVLCEVHPPES